MIIKIMSTSVKQIYRRYMKSKLTEEN